MQALNNTSLNHPRSQWEIEACLHRATEYGAAIAMTATGREIVTAIHDRDSVPAFSFWRDGQDITGEFLKVIRGHAAGVKTNA
jgi:hypothetical protein